MFVAEIENIEFGFGARLGKRLMDMGQPKSNLKGIRNIPKTNLNVPKEPSGPLTTNPGARLGKKKKTTLTQPQQPPVMPKAVGQEDLSKYVLGKRRQANQPRPISSAPMERTSSGKVKIPKKSNFNLNARMGRKKY